eukprot:2423300-Rhodomonas_salina.3
MVLTTLVCQYRTPAQSSVRTSSLTAERIQRQETTISVPLAAARLTESLFAPPETKSTRAPSKLVQSPVRRGEVSTKIRAGVLVRPGFSCAKLAQSRRFGT